MPGKSRLAQSTHGGDAGIPLPTTGTDRQGTSLLLLTTTSFGTVRKDACQRLGRITVWKVALPRAASMQRLKQCSVLAAPLRCAALG